MPYGDKTTKKKNRIEIMLNIITVTLKWGKIQIICIIVPPQNTMLYLFFLSFLLIPFLTGNANVNVTIYHTTDGFSSLILFFCTNDSNPFYSHIHIPFIL